MLLSALAPLHNLPISELLRGLRQIKMDLGNVRGGGNRQALANYQRWANGAAHSLGFHLAPQDVERLILTRRYWALLEMEASSLHSRLISDLLDGECTDRLRVLEGEIKMLEAIEGAWAGLTAKIVVADTNVYLHSPDYFDHTDWRELAGASEIRLLVPMQIVRELDRTKRTGKNATVSEANHESIRTRARLSSTRLRERFVDPGGVVQLGSGVSAELLIDPIGHVAIADPDTEILDHVLTAKRLTGRQISVVTMDGNMQFAAAVAGLDVIGLPD